MKIPKIFWAILPGLAFAGLFIGNMVLNKSNAQGPLLYAAHCANCHGEKGEGLEKLIPPLAKADYLKKNQEKIACIIRYGLKGEVIVNGVMYNYPMYPNESLKEVDITNLINYINQQWGNNIPERNFQEVAQDLRKCSE